MYNKRNSAPETRTLYASRGRVLSRSGPEIIDKIVGATGFPGVCAIGSLAGAAGPAAVVGGGLGLGADTHHGLA